LGQRRFLSSTRSSPTLETDEEVRVVVFDSAVDGFFLTHYDFTAKLEDTTRFPAGPTGLQALPDMLARVSRAPVVSIASIRGRATGVGSELALASDMRFASREKAVLSQWEVGAGLVPGGGPMARLPRLIGRGVNSLPPDAEIVPEWEAFLAALGRPAAQERIRMLFERGFHEPGDVETRLGYHVGQLGSAE
jgi:hypothetical protein